MQLRLFTLEGLPFLDTVILHNRVSWSIRLRWVAVLGYFFATLIAKSEFGLQLPFDKIWGILAILALINLLYFIICQLMKHISPRTELVFLHVHIILDLVFLSFLVHLSGGIENPVYLFYVFHVVISSIIFPTWSAYIFATLVVIMFSSLSMMEYRGIIPHHCILEQHSENNALSLFLVLTVFTITVYVTTYICTGFMRIYRAIKIEIDKKNQQLIATDRQKTRFFQFASHELKSPIIAVKSTVDTVLKSFSGDINDKAVNLLRRASIRSGQMLEIVNELLELSRTRDSIKEKETEEIEVRALLEELVKQESTHAEDKNIELTAELAKHCVFLSGKRNDFEKIFANLINNAIRYTPEGGKVTVKSRIENDHLNVEIRDTGIGIAVNDLKHIFEEFYRSENAKKTVAFGTGLGLSLVKQLVENYAGKIDVHSILDHGTTFTVRLPVHDKT